MKKKELDREQQTFCSMTGHILFNTPFCIDPKTNWEKLFKEVTDHSVSCIFADILHELPLGNEIRKRWEKHNMAVMANGIQVRFGQQRLVVLLKEHGIPFVILKGTAAAYYYPKPDYRAMGDIDFLVRDEDFQRVIALLEKNGYIHTSECGDKLRHESFEKDKIHYECHKRFAVQSRKYADMIDSITIKGIENRVWRMDHDEMFPMLSDERNGLIFIEHIAHHLESGLGMRQIMDWLAYVEKSLKDEQWNSSAGRYIRKCGFETLAKTVTRIGQLYFGLDQSIKWCRDADLETCYELISLIFSYGNFGRKDAVESHVVKVMQHYQKDLWSNLKNAGEFNWKILHRHPGLKPFAPFYQVFRYTCQIVTTKGAIKNLLLGSKKAKKRASLLERLEIQ